jgi:histidinol-phosphate aminotransferase
MDPGSGLRDDRIHVSRRRFLEATTGGAALSLLGLPVLAGERGSGLAPPDAGAYETTAPGARGRSEILRDYTGRLCYNENPLGPSPAAKSAIIAAADLGHRYPDWLAESLRADLADLHGVGSGQVIAGSGGTEMLRLAALAFAEPGRNVVCPYPSYSQFPSDCSFLGAEVRYADLDAAFRTDLGAIAALVDANTTAVCLTNPNNPTATVRSAADIAAFVAALPGQVAVVIDEAYHDYVHDPGYGSAVALVALGRNVVVIRTFSKAYGMAGVRVGYAVGRQSLISAMGSWQTIATVSRLALDGARAALQDLAHIASTVALNDEAKAYCFASFDAMGLADIPSETNFFMVDVGRPAGPVATQLAARGIQVRTGWGMPNHLRVSTGTMEDMQAFIAALTEILELTGAPDGLLPEVTLLHGNFPNPTRAGTRILYSLAVGGHVRLAVYDVQGRFVRSLIDRHEERGHHEIEWDGRNHRGAPCAPGSYFYRLEAQGLALTRRMVRIRG